MALGYKGACIMLSEDYHHNRHILKRNNYTLCGKKTIIQKMVMKDGRFTGYLQGSATGTWGFYGSGRCKTCLIAYFKHRLSKEGKKMLRLYNARVALRLPTGVG